MNSPSASKSIFITANSPGEIAGWVVPIVEKLKSGDPAVRIILVITPCQYASGLESEVGSSLPGVDRVVRIGTLIKESIFHKESLHPAPGSKVFFLGGDPVYAVWLARLLKVPAWAYMNKPRHRKHYAKYMVTDEPIRKRFLDAGMEPERVETVGHLSLDSVRISGSREEILGRLTGGDPDIVTILPGSRPIEIQYLVPFLVEAAQVLAESHPKTNLFFAVSPFADRKLLADVAGRANARLDGDAIAMANGRRIRLVSGNTHDLMSVSKLIVTIPGTNNLQIAAMGVPMLIVTPLNWAEHIPVDGIVGLLSAKVYPFALLKRHLILRRLPYTQYVSLPNILAGRMIVPEMLGILQPAEVASRAAELLDSQELLSEIVRNMQELTSVRGAADRISCALLSDESPTSGGTGN